MSNLLLNLRIGYWHFQIARDRPWLSFSRNEWRRERKMFRPIIQLH